LTAWGVQRVIELDWWSASTSSALRITCVPAQHFSGRRASDRQRRLWCGWCLRMEDQAVYFAGDTGLHPVFGEIGVTCGPFDAALIPIGAYAPRWFMRSVHLDPDEAVAAFRALTSPQSSPCRLVPVHWGTFKLSDEPMREPPERLRAAWEKSGPSGHHLALLAPGEVCVL
jgi:N-acyl-phosphatidylethanolamine-hydrolysing phospholipase D